MRLSIAICMAMTLLVGSLVSAQEFKTKMVPDFTLPDINGKVVKLSDNFGKGPIYISFWMTWCKPCVEELKIIEKLYEKYKDQGFIVYAINSEGPKAYGKAKAFVNSSGWKFNVLFDNDGEVFRRKFKGFATPYSVLTDPHGKIIFSSVGFKPGDEVAVEKLIKDNLISLTADTTKSDLGK